MDLKGKRYITVCTVAGSDSSGGAGIQADLKTFSALGVYGASCITAVTAQNTKGVSAMQVVRQSVVRAQLSAVFCDLQPIAVKTGMLYNSGIMRCVAKAFVEYRPRFVVADPVMVSSSGSLLMEKEAIGTFVDVLFPLVSLLTPNIYEAEILTGMKILNERDMVEAGRRLTRFFGVESVLIKGGHLAEKESVDVFISRTCRTIKRFALPYVATRNNHGTGCTLSAAITAFLALGYSLPVSVSKAKLYLHRALIEGADVVSGGGHGSVNHFFAPCKAKTYECNENIG